jgi:hypothetical protein
MSGNVQFHKNGGKGIVITDKQPITGKQGIVLSFSTNKELFDFYERLGKFIEDNYKGDGNVGGKENLFIKRGSFN